MTKPMVRIHNVATDEVTDREMTDIEYKSFLADQAAYQVEKTKEADAQIARTALLEKLGITEDEARLLLG